MNRRAFTIGGISMAAAAGAAFFWSNLSGDPDELHIISTKSTRNELCIGVLLDFQEIRSETRTAIVRTIKTGNHTMTAYPIQNVIFVEYEDNYYRVEADRSVEETGRARTPELGGRSRNVWTASAMTDDPQHTTKESDEQHETYRYSVIDTYPGFEAVCDAIVDSLVLPFERGQVNDSAYGVVETAVKEGEYTASPMTDTDAEAYQFLNEYDHTRADAYYPYYVRFEDQYYRLDIQHTSGE